MTFYKVFHQSYKYGLNTLLKLMILTFKSTIALNLLLDNNKILRIMRLRTAKNVFKREGEVKKEMVRSKSLNLMFLRPNTKMIMEFQKNNVHLCTYLQRMFKCD